jgi:hypothetical protein
MDFEYENIKGIIDANRNRDLVYNQIKGISDYNTAMDDLYNSLDCDRAK